MEKSIENYSASELLDILSFHVENGVDCCLDEEPSNHFSAPQKNAPQISAQAAPNQQQASNNKLPEHYYEERKRPQSRPQPVASVQPQQSFSNEAAIEAARMAAENANSIEELRIAIEKFEHCSLKRSAANTVFASGDLDSSLMILSEMPSRQDDEAGSILTGEEGRLFDAILSAIGTDRHSAYLASALPWRPAGGRQATPVEQQICNFFARKHIQLTKCKIIIALGQGAVSCLIDNEEGVQKKGIMQLRGNWLQPKCAPDRDAIASLTPSYLLQQPAHKRLAWADWQMVQSALSDIS